MRRLGSIALMGILALCGLQAALAWEGDRDETLRLQAALETRVSAILHSYDPKGMVVLKLIPRTARQALPATPFYGELSERDARGNVQIEAVTISILVTKPPFPESISELVKTVVTSDGYPSPTIKVDALPAELSAARDEDPSISVIRKALEQQAESTRNAVEVSAALKSDLRMGGLGALFVVLALFAVRLREQAKRDRAVQDAARTVGDGLAKMSLPPPAPSNAREIRAPVAVASSRSSASSGPGLERHSEESLLACLMDCYWSEEDGYAAFIWKRIDVGIRKGMVTRFPLLSEYASFLMQGGAVEEVDLGIVDEPCYLAPLPIHHLDNATLTAVVRQQPAVYFGLSTLRIGRLALSPVERIKVTRLTREPVRGEIASALAELKRSRPRPLRSRSMILVRTLEEETEILALEGLSVELMAEVPSLGWLERLPKDQAAEILSAYPARELAQAWVGPKDLLGRLISHVAPKKRELLEAYLDGASPSRDSAVYKEIHRKTISALREFAGKSAGKSEGKHVQAA